MRGHILNIWRSPQFGFRGSFNLEFYFARWSSSAHNILAGSWRLVFETLTTWSLKFSCALSKDWSHGLACSMLYQPTRNPYIFSLNVPVLVSSSGPLDWSFDFVRMCLMWKDLVVVVRILHYMIKLVLVPDDAWFTI